MNSNQVQSLLRAILNIVGTAAMARGYGTSSDWEEFTGLGMTAVGVAWGLLHHRQPRQPKPKGLPVLPASQSTSAPAPKSGAGE